MLFPSRFGVAMNAVTEGAKIVRQLADTHLQSASKGGNFRDLKTAADDASESAITKLIGQYFPQDAIYAEESWKAGDRIDPEKMTWVIDPVDGTTNLAAGISLVAVGLGLMQVGVVRFGVIKDIFKQETYCSEESGEAYFLSDGARIAIKVCVNTDLQAGLIVYDMPGASNRIPLVEAFMQKANRRAQAARIFGCAHLSLCYLARGLVGGYVNADLHDWDVAPGLALVERAGGIITDWKGNLWEPHGRKHGIIAAATPEIHTTLLGYAREVMAKTGIDPATI